MNQKNLKKHWRDLLKPSARHIEGIKIGPPRDSARIRRSILKKISARLQADKDADS